jgi:hypothetical protein
VICPSCRTRNSCCFRIEAGGWVNFLSTTPNFERGGAPIGDAIVPTVTGKVYNHSKRMKEKRVVLDGVAAELRRIIGQPAQAGDREALRIAA